MTKEQIKLSIQNNEINLNFWEKLSHFALSVFFLILPMTILFLHIKDYIQGKIVPFREAELGIIVIPLILSFLFYKLKRKRLKLKSVETNLAYKELDVIITDVAEKLDWRIYLKNEKVIIARTFPSFLHGSWGEQITIIFDVNRILINSICDPNKKSSIVSFGRNKKNTDTLITEVKKSAH